MAVFLFSPPSIIMPENHCTCTWLWGFAFQVQWWWWWWSLFGV